jgi:hypothetical protein
MLSLIRTRVERVRICLSGIAASSLSLVHSRHLGIMQTECLYHSTSVLCTCIGSTQVHCMILVILGPVRFNPY